MNLIPTKPDVRVSPRRGLTTIESAFTQTETLRRLIREIEHRGLTIFARVDHAALARTALLDLRPTEMLIFGNPRAGTTLMQEDQAIGIDLPLRALVWTDWIGKTWIGYTEPTALVFRHKIEPPGVVGVITQMLQAIAGHAARPNDPASPWT